MAGLRSGVLVQVRQGVERKRRVWLAALLVLALDAVLEPLLGLPWAAYADWGRERVYGLTERTFGGWAGSTGLARHGRSVEAPWS